MATLLEDVQKFFSWVLKDTIEVWESVCWKQDFDFDEAVVVTDKCTKISMVLYRNGTEYGYMWDSEACLETSSPKNQLLPSALVEFVRGLAWHYSDVLADEEEAARVECGAW